MRLSCLVLCAGLLVAAGPAARAAGVGDVYVIEESNKIGVLEYCQDQHFATAQNIENMRKVMRGHQDMPDEATLENARQLGRKGIMMAAGQQYTIAALASRSNGSIESVCGAIAANADMAVNLMKKN